MVTLQRFTLCLRSSKHMTLHKHISIHYPQVICWSMYYLADRPTIQSRNIEVTCPHLVLPCPPCSPVPLTMQLEFSAALSTAPPLCRTGCRTLYTGGRYLLSPLPRLPLSAAGRRSLVSPGPCPSATAPPLCRTAGLSRLWTSWSAPLPSRCALTCTGGCWPLTGSTRTAVGPGRTSGRRPVPSDVSWSPVTSDVLLSERRARLRWPADYRLVFEKLCPVGCLPRPRWRCDVKCDVMSQCLPVCDVTNVLLRLGRASSSVSCNCVLRWCLLCCFWNLASLWFQFSRLHVNIKPCNEF